MGCEVVILEVCCQMLSKARVSAKKSVSLDYMAPLDSTFAFDSCNDWPFDSEILQPGSRAAIFSVPRIYGLARQTKGKRDYS